jgi:hypothetical protein
MNKEERQERLNKLWDVAQDFLEKSTWITLKGYRSDYFACRWCGKGDNTMRHHELDCPYLNFKKEYALIILDSIYEEEDNDKI